MIIGCILTNKSQYHPAILDDAVSCNHVKSAFANLRSPARSGQRVNLPTALLEVTLQRLVGQFAGIATFGQSPPRFKFLGAHRHFWGARARYSKKIPEPGRLITAAISEATKPRTNLAVVPEFTLIPRLPFRGRPTRRTFWTTLRSEHFVCRTNQPCLLRPTVGFSGGIGLRLPPRSRQALYQTFRHDHTAIDTSP